MARRHQIQYPALIVLLAMAGFLVSSTPPASPAPDIPFAFAALGDNGCGCEEQQLVASRMIQWHVKKPFYTVVMLGDNIYGPRATGGSMALFADRFDRYYQPLLMQGVKFYAALGNHDMEANQGRDEIADKNRFHISGDLGYYSFSPAPQVGDRALVTFFVLNSERLLNRGGDSLQIQWLSRELTLSKAIWKVVCFHEPIYAPEGAHKPASDMKEGIEKIMVSGGVSLVLAGHDHFYARMKPQGGITYIISGGGGRTLARPKSTDMTVIAAREHHFVYFEVFPDQLMFQTVAASGVILDQGAILPPAVAR